jgi:glycyl-tRNA synthetase
VGHADRSCYDLEVHSRACGVPHVASERLPEPVAVERLVCEPLRKKIGPKFKANQKEVIAALEGLDAAEVQALQAQLAEAEAAGGGGGALVKGFQISSDMVSIKLERKNVHEVKYAPSVIEPSFGIGRIMYALLEHAFSQREGDEQRCVMALAPFVAATKVGIFRLTNNNPHFDVVVEQVRRALHEAGVTCKVDSSSGTIGRRYARADEVGVPFGVTIDFDTLMDSTVTLRERDSMAQIRIPIAALAPVLARLSAASLSQEHLSWEQLAAKYPTFVYDTDADAAPAVGEKQGTKKPALTLQKTSRATFSRPNDL